MKLDISILLIQINPRLNVTECRRGFWASARASASPSAACPGAAQQCPASPARPAWLQLLLWWYLRKTWNCCRVLHPNPSC